MLVEAKAPSQKKTIARFPSRKHVASTLDGIRLDFKTLRIYISAHVAQCVGTGRASYGPEKKLRTMTGF